MVLENAKNRGQFLFPLEQVLRQIGALSGSRQLRNSEVKYFNLKIRIEKQAIPKLGLITPGLKGTQSALLPR